MRVRSLAAVIITFAIAACSDARSPMAPSRPLADISDGAHSSGNPDFFFLPPMVSNPAPGTNVTGLSPVVDICLPDGTGCLAHFTTDLGTTTTTQPGNSETVRESSDGYIVNWHTAAFDLTVGGTYRICVSVGSQALGHADVDVVGSGKDLKNVNTGEFVALLDDRTLPIKFRIQEGALSQSADQGCGAAGAEIDGLVFNDLNGNGVNNDGAVEVGWTVTLTNGSGSQTATTDGNGMYKFTGLQPGTYTVCEQLQATYIQTFPAGAGSCPGGTLGYTVLVKAGQTYPGNDFGVLSPPM